MNKKKITSALLSVALLSGAVMPTSAIFAEAKGKVVQSVNIEQEYPFSQEYDLLKLATLYEDGYRTENFRNMDTILPHNFISSNEDRMMFATSNTLKKKPNYSFFHNLSYSYKGKKGNLNELLKRTETTGLLVMKNGKIVVENYYSGNDSESHNTSWSMAKSYISALVGIAINEGHIKSVNDKVTKYLPDLKGTAFDGVTIKNLLQMSSGVGFNEDYADPNSDINYLIPYLFFEGGNIKDYVKTLKREDKVGTYKYKSIDTQVLGLLVQQVTGKSISEYLTEKIWKPLDMESNAYWNTDLEGNEITFAVLNATLRDYAKFGELYLNDGKYKGKQIIPKSWIKESTIPGRKELQAGVADPEFGYQYQWWVPKGSKKGNEFVAIGIYGQYTYVNKKENVVIVKTSTDPSIIENDGEVIESFRAIVEQLKKKK